MLDMLGHIAWRPPVMRTISRDNQGIPELWEQVQKFREHLQTSGEWEKRRQKRRQDEVLAIVESHMQRRVKQFVSADEGWADKLTAVEQGTVNPYALADEMVGKLLK